MMRREHIVADAPVLLNVEEAAHICGVSARTVRRWCQQGRLPALKPGARHLIDREALVARVLTNQGGESP